MERTQHAKQVIEATREEAEHWNLFRDVVVPGAIAGMLGAVVMAALALPLGVLTHGDLWYAARLAGGVFQREAPNGTLAVLLGLGVHVATAGGLATLFAMLLPRGGTGTAALMLGVLMGLALQVVMPALVIPWASPPLDREMPHAALLLLHLAFGASLGAVVPARGLVTTLDRMRRAVHGARHAVG
ncbi:MAG: hypothetical protein ACJ8AT_07180 [Hyalangium sp.]|uniref:hypothetical protein n=1 Tax=Hyalangium sp. TaxID=2028555 RepID=UPI00389A18EC